MLLMNRQQAEAVSDALSAARDLKAYVLLLSHSPNPPDQLLIEQARKLDQALAVIESTK